jgi:molybdopterin-guanine dinucleotide biosynthesis protein A
MASSVSMSDLPFTSIVLAGGAAHRLGGIDKPSVRVAGVSMIERVLAAAGPSGRTIVVGPANGAVGVRTIQESPPGGGPVAAIGAAFATVEAEVADVVAILGGDLPLLTAGAIAELRAVAARGRVDGAVYVDTDGRRQWLCGAWRAESIACRLAALVDSRGSLDGAALRELFGALAVAEVVGASDPPPWFDCDTEDDIRRAEEWLTG